MATPPIEPTPNDPRFAPTISSTVRAPAQHNGAIYQVGYAIDLYHDHRAHRIGDIITINLNESTSAKKSSETSFKKENKHNSTDATVAGQTGAGGILRNIGQALGDSDLSLLSSVDSTVDFAGEADSDQSNSLSGNITVTVADVLPNGILVVRGEKWLRLNKGDEYIRISGLVRQEDISPDNSVSSTRLADVRITYSSTGTLADSNEPSWLTKFFVGTIWPF